MPKSNDVMMPFEQSDPTNTLLEQGSRRSSLCSLDSLESSIKSSSDSSFEFSIKPKPPLQETWNNPRGNIIKLYTCCFGFIIFGMIDASVGGIVQYLERDYQVSHAQVSLSFFFAFLGYISSAVTSEYMHRKLGRLGVSRLGVFLELVSYFLASTKPPFYIFVGGFVITGYGNGLLGASWNAWAGNLENKNEALGVIHGCYGIGALASPAIETLLISYGYDWTSIYILLLIMSVISCFNTYYAFKNEGPKEYREAMEADEKYRKFLESQDHDDDNNDEKENLLLKSNRSEFYTIVTSKLLWLFASTLFFYVGSEVTIGGWVATFMIKVRQGREDRMGLVTTSFWSGIAIGRLTLGFVGGKIRREQLMTSVYMCLSIAFFALFSISPTIGLSTAFIALTGFFMGPLYPTIVIVFLNKIPKKLQILGIGFTTSFGGIGSALNPFLNGILSSAVGPWVLSPFILTLMLIMIISWMAIVKFF